MFNTAEEAMKFKDIFTAAKAYNASALAGTPTDPPATVEEVVLKSKGEFQKSVEDATISSSLSSATITTDTFFSFGSSSTLNISEFLEDGCVAEDFFIQSNIYEL